MKHLHVIVRNVCIEASKDKFKCRGIPHSPNKTGKMHWSLKRRWALAWQEEVATATKQARTQFYYYEKNKGEGMTKFPLEQATLRFKLYTRRSQDQDNAMASLKPLIDGLRYAKVLVDDSPAHCTIEKPETVVVGNPAEERTEIFIEWNDEIKE